MLCVSPEMTRIGRLIFEVHIERGHSSFSGISYFLSGEYITIGSSPIINIVLHFWFLPCVVVAHDKASEVVIESGSFITTDSLLGLSWPPESILPIKSPDNNCSVDITIRHYNDTTRNWTYVDIIKDVPNTGHIEVLVPDFDFPDSALPAIVQISVSEVTSGIFSNNDKVVLRAIRAFTSVVILVKGFTSEMTLRESCEEWGLTQSRDEALQTIASVPGCLCTISAISGADFEEERVGSIISNSDSERCFRERKG